MALIKTRASLLFRPYTTKPTVGLFFQQPFWIKLQILITYNSNLEEN